MQHDPARPDSSTAACGPPKVLGVLAVTIGVQILLAMIGFPVTLWIFVLGVLILQHWFTARNFPALVAGGLIAGVGLGAIAKDVVPGAALDSFLGAAGWTVGFAIVAGVGGRAARWAYFGAAFAAVVALGSLGLAAGSALSNGGVLLPGLIVSAGILLVLKGSRRGLLLPIVVGAALLLVSAGVGGSDGGVNLSARRAVSASAGLPGLDGRTLVIDADDASVTVEIGRPEVSGTVMVDRGRPARREADAERALAPAETDDEVVLSSALVTSYVVTVPPGTDVRIETGDGDVRVEGEGGDVEVETENGRIAVSGWFEQLELTTDNGEIDADLEFVNDDHDIEIDSDNGSIDVRITGAPAIDAESDNGGVRFDGDDEGDSYEASGEQGELRIRADNGSVRLEPVSGSRLR